MSDTPKPKITRKSLERLMRELAQLQKAGALNSRPKAQK
jgi:hypothetical protein